MGDCGNCRRLEKTAEDCRELYEEDDCRRLNCKGMYRGVQQCRTAEDCGGLSRSVGTVLLFLITSNIQLEEDCGGL